MLILALNSKQELQAQRDFEGLSVSCTCGASTSLKGAFDPNIFKELDEKMKPKIFCVQAIILLKIQRQCADAIRELFKEVHLQFIFQLHIVR